MENLCIRIDVDHNLRYFAQQGVLDDDDNLDVFTTSPKFRRAIDMERWIRDDCQPLEVLHYSIFIELCWAIVRKHDHVRLETFMVDTNDIHETRRSY